MTGTITIGTQSRTLDDTSESWIADQINRHRRDGNVVVVITLKSAAVNIRLSTPGASVGSGCGRALNARELQIFNLWNERRLNTLEFSAGNVIAFLKQVARLL